MLTLCGIRHCGTMKRALARMLLIGFDADDYAKKLK